MSVFAWEFMFYETKITKSLIFHTFFIKIYNNPGSVCVLYISSGRLFGLARNLKVSEDMYEQIILKFDATFYLI